MSETVENKRGPFRRVSDYLRGKSANSASRNRKHLRPSAFKRKTGQVLAKGFLGIAIIFAFFLSVGSFLTTMEGMVNFTSLQGDESGLNSYSWIISGFVSLGVQGVLFMISWVVAQDLADRSRIRSEQQGAKPSLFARTFGRRERRRRNQAAADGEPEVVLKPYWTANSGRLAMLVISMFVSIFFSFDSLHERVFKPSERAKVELSIARSETAETFSLLRTGLLAERSEKLQALSETQGWNTFTENLENVLKTAQDSGEIVDRFLREKREALLGEAAATKQLLTTKLKEREVIKTDINKLKSGAEVTSTDAVSDLKKALEQKEGQVAELQARADELDVLMGEEAAYGGTDPRTGKVKPCRRAGGCKGKKWRALNDKKTVVLGQLAPLKQQRDQLASRLGRAQTNLASTGSRLERLQQSLAPLDQEIATLQAKLENDQKLLQAQDKAASSGPASGQGASSDVVSTVRKAKSDFLLDGDITHFDTMASGCLSLLATLEDARETTNDDSFSGLTCDASAISVGIDDLRVFREGLAAVAKQCVVNREYNDLKTVAAYMDKGRECLNIAKLPIKREQPIRAKLDQIERENSPETSNFTRSVASLKRGDILAWVALALAISIDSLVFCSALAGGFASNRVQKRGNGVLPTREALPDLTIYPIDSMQVKTRKWLLAVLDEHNEIASDGESRSFRYVDLNRIGPKDIRTHARASLMMYPEKKVARRGLDVYELNAEVIENEAEHLREELRYQEHIYGDMHRAPTDTGPQYAGYDDDKSEQNGRPETVFDKTNPAPASGAAGSANGASAEKRADAAGRENVTPLRRQTPKTPEGNTDPNAGTRKIFR